MPTGETAVRCLRVCQTFVTPGGEEVEALRGVDAEIAGGAVTAIAGPSGSGKSSLLRLLAALERPTSGQVLVGGDDLRVLSTRRRRVLRRRRIGFVPSHASAALARGITVGEELRVAAAARGASGWREPAERRLAALGLGERWDARTEHLSGGEQQRVAVVSALVGEPAVLLADEPSAALDSSWAAALLDELHRVAASGTTVVVATHDPVVMGAADTVVRLRSGRVER